MYYLLPMQTLAASDVDPVDPAASAAASARLDGPDWWRTAIGYEIYIRSFYDTNGDGVGDLAGVTAKLDYLHDLGVDVVWLTPFFPSPGHDHGYDVSDYCDIDPQFGTLADFDSMIAAAHARDLRVFIDLVPNHTSSEHRWFTQAIADVASPFRQYYHFRDPAPDGGPPNNWVGHFGGSAWTLDPSGSGQYYLHLFLPEQPDLNWVNPAVLDEFAAVLKFWCERGADGFRIDVAHGLAKDSAYRDNPQVRPITAGMHPTDVFHSFEHCYDLHQAETAEIFRQWRRVVVPYGAVLLGEMDTRDVARFGDYVARRDALDLGFVLKIGLTEWDPAEYIGDLVDFAYAANGGAAWEVSNHDQARAVSRFAESGGGLQDDEVGLRRTLALTTLMVGMDGMTFIYQGEELGLPNAKVVGQTQDPMSARNGGGWGRDVARGAMPWDSSSSNGFTSAEQAWLHTERLPDHLTAEFQLTRPESTWARYRDLIMIRKRFRDAFTVPMRLRLRTDSAMVIERGKLIFVANFGTETFAYSSPHELTVEYESAPGATGAAGAHTGGSSDLLVQPESTVIVRRHV